MGIDPDPVNSKEHILLSNLVSHAWSQGESLSLGDLIRGISDPPFDRIGVMGLETFYPASERQKLAMRLNGVSRVSRVLGVAWMASPSTFSACFGPRMASLESRFFRSLHLSEAERMFFVSMLLNRVVSWVRTSVRHIEPSRDPLHG